jgi:hypothetical protein
MFFNPVFWLLTLTYIFFEPQTGSFIRSLYPPVIYYLGVFTLIFGNLFYIFTYMMAAAKRQQWHLLIFGLLIPFYWIMISVAAIYAGWELIVRPHHWNKTKHGLHLLHKVQATHPQTIVISQE